MAGRKSVDHGPARIAAEADGPEQRHRAKRNAPFGILRCPECMEEYGAVHPNQLFCCNRHRDAWRARDTRRARQVFALDMVARITRDGTRGTPEQRELGKKAASSARMLRRKWKDEDIAAKRMLWTDYLRHRIAIGFDPI